jgi:hypothetical protein
MKPTPLYDNLLIPLLLLVGLCFMLSSCAALSLTKQKAQNEQDWADIEEKYGIEILGIQPSAAGYMLDFRYRVVDAEKASPLFHPTVKPYLIDQKTGTSMTVPAPPKVGALRQRSAKSARTNYTSFILFANPGSQIKPSDKVTIVIGDLRIENLVVR